MNYKEFTIIDRRVEGDEVEYWVRTPSRGKENHSEKWVKDADIKDRKKIAQYDEATIKNRTIKEIIGATTAKSRRNVTSIWFYVQWVDEQICGAWLSSEVLKASFPQDLIKFYEGRLTISWV